MLAQRLDRAGAVHDVAVGGIGDQLVDIPGAEGEVALAQNYEIGVGEAGGLAEAAVDTPAVAGPFLVERDRARRLGSLEGRVRAVVADDDDSPDERMGEEIGDGGADALLVIVGGEGDAHHRVAHRPVADGEIRPLAVEEEE